MAVGSIARRYARALLGTVDEGAGAPQKRALLVRELGDLSRVMSTSEEFATVLANPAFSRSSREKVLDALLRRLVVSAHVGNFAKLLLQRNRMLNLPAIAREFNNMVDEIEGRVAAKVTSAMPLSALQLADIKRMLTEISQKDVQLEAVVDPSLIGGLVAQVGDVVYDGSVKAQLGEMADRLLAKRLSEQAGASKSPVEEV